MELLDRFSQSSDRDGLYYPDQVILHMDSSLELIDVEVEVSQFERYLEKGWLGLQLPVRDVLVDGEKQMVLVRMRRTLPARQYLRMRFHYKYPPIYTKCPRANSFPATTSRRPGRN